MHRRKQVAIVDGKDYWHALHVVEIKNCDFLEVLEGTEVELKARPHLSMIQVAVLHVAVGLEDQADIGTKAKVGIEFGEIGGDGCLRVKRRGAKHKKRRD